MSDPHGPVFIDSDAFDELERALTDPAKPTQSIIDGAQLMRNLYRLDEKLGGKDAEMSDNVIPIGTEFRRKPLIKANEKWQSPEPSDLMVWEACVYTRGNGKMECQGCPATEPHIQYGAITRGCRMLAAEACRTMMAVQRLEAQTNRPAPQ